MGCHHRLSALLLLNVIAVLQAGPPMAETERKSIVPVGNDATVDVCQLIHLAEKRDAAAQYELGVLRGNGEGVPQDLAEAARWFRLAARQGHDQARAAVAFLEEAGLVKTPPKIVMAA